MKYVVLDICVLNFCLKRLQHFFGHRNRTENHAVRKFFYFNGTEIIVFLCKLTKNIILTVCETHLQSNYV